MRKEVAFIVIAALAINSILYLTENHYTNTKTLFKFKLCNFEKNDCYLENATDCNCDKLTYSGYKYVISFTKLPPTLNGCYDNIEDNCVLYMGSLNQEVVFRLDEIKTYKSYFLFGYIVVNAFLFIMLTSIKKEEELQPTAPTESNIEMSIVKE